MASSEASETNHCGYVENKSKYGLLDLPWEDILLKHILSCLSWWDLFHFRQASRQTLQVVSLFFSTTPKMDLSRIGSLMNADAFALVTKDNRVLRTLVLRNCKSWLKDDCLIDVLKNNPRLSHINLQGCLSISNACIQTLVISCKDNIKKIVLKDCHWLTPGALTVIAIHCPNLEYIDLSSCWEVNDEAVSALVIACRRLLFLSISRIYGITDIALNAVGRCCINLRHLNIQGCWRVTDDSIRLVAEYCKSLKCLQVRECRDITEASLQRMRIRGVKIDVPPFPPSWFPGNTPPFARINVQI